MLLCRIDLQNKRGKVTVLQPLELVELLELVVEEAALGFLG